MFKNFLVILSLLMPTFAVATADACLPDIQDTRAADGTTAWAIPVHDIAAGSQPIAIACDIESLAAQVATFAERHPGSVVSITGYAKRSGSPSLALARVSLVVNRLQQSVLQRIGRLRMPIEARLIADQDTTSDPGVLGQIILRLHSRKPL